MEIKVLGELEILDAGKPVPVRGAKQRALLAMLALQRGKAVSADRLIDELWDEKEVTNPANALQAQIGQLRRTLGADAVVTSEAGYALSIGPGDLDADRFERLVAEGRRLSDNSEMCQASTVLTDALRLIGGEPLAEFAYSGFADAERRHLGELTLVAIETRIEADLELGRHGELVGELEALCGEHALRERLWELLMLALYRAGRQAEALRAYTEIRDRLVGELGIDPGPALRELDARILVQDPSLAASDPAGLQMIPESTQRGNLLERLSSFVGRTEELEELIEAVRSGRLVTLIGPGGVGKTRLALEAAATLRQDHRDGAWLVELASVTEPEGVAPAVVGALGAAAAGLAGPPSQDSTVELIVRHLAGRSPLIVLDNCEHVIDQTASLAETLVAAVPGLRLIATSREALGVRGEVLVPVGPLSLPAALELFVDRARAVRPGFAPDEHNRPLLDDICRRLDRLPLAIELAAARLRSLALDTLAARLDDRFRLLTVGARTALPRQQTLRAVVDWSYDLLFEDERRLFARLSVFVGGCELDAVEAVCADDQVPIGEILDVLSRLIDKSLVGGPNAGRETRFTLLQTLSEYGRERLNESGDVEAMCARHAAHYRQMAEGANERLRGATGPLWRERLTSELGNLRAALDWFIATGDADAALSLASGMAWLWFINSEFVEGARWLGDALGANGERRSEFAATARVSHSFLVCMAFGPAAAISECQAALVALTTGDDGIRRAESLVLCATVLMRAQEHQRSLEVLKEAHDLLEETEDGWQLAQHDWIVAENLMLLGRFDDAEPSARSSAECFRARGDVWASLGPLSMLGGIAAARGDLEGASATYEALLERSRGAGQRSFELFGLGRLAALRARQGNDAAADGLYEEALARCFRPLESADLMVGQAAVARRLGDLARARALLDAAGSYYQNVGLCAGQTGVLAGLAWWALGAGRADDAMAFAVDASQVAPASGDSAVQLLADTAVAAVRASADPTPGNVETLVALAEQRSQSLPYGSLISFTDGPDVAALAARLALQIR